MVKKKSEMKYTNKYAIRRTGKVQVKPLDLDLNRMRKKKVRKIKIETVISYKLYTAISGHYL